MAVYQYWGAPRRHGYHQLPDEGGNPYVIFREPPRRGVRQRRRQPRRRRATPQGEPLMGLLAGVPTGPIAQSVYTGPPRRATRRQRRDLALVPVPPPYVVDTEDANSEASSVLSVQGDIIELEQPAEPTPETLIMRTKGVNYKKNVHYTKGKIRSQVCNSVEVKESAELPLFVRETEYKTKATKILHRNTRVPALAVDQELGYLLLLEALFLPRTPRLLLQLKLKAKQAMRKYDFSAYTRKEQLELVSEAITFAMQISPQEERCRRLLGSAYETKIRGIHTAFTKGTVYAGGSSLLCCQKQASHLAGS
uniref:Uncharacterized protein n=1 Tax=Phasmatodean tombus-related virus TaxID=2822558 RepID=A0A8A6RH48_9TOMB|nr:hypothetical protein [Phasmatodean tombus-related virus]